MAMIKQFMGHNVVFCHEDRIYSEPFRPGGNGSQWNDWPSAGGKILDFTLDTDDSVVVALVETPKGVVLKKLNWRQGNVSRSWQTVKQL